MIIKMEAFEIQDLKAQSSGQAIEYVEFLRRYSMSMGLYRLDRGAQDPQSPHLEDEVYVVLEGRAKIQVGAEDRSVDKGSIVFVPKNMEHRFHSIEDSLLLLVFFSPAESR